MLRESSITVRTLLPCLNWLKVYQSAWLPHDMLAGATLAAYAIPVSLAYAALAGVPPHYGVYCYLVAGLGYAALGSSRQLAVGPTAAIAMMVGATVGPLAQGDPARWAAIAALTALLVAVLAGLAWLLRLSGLVSFISETILTGFKAGAALTIGMTQLPKLLGVAGGGESFFERGWILLGQLGDTEPLVLGLGIGAMILLAAGDRLLPGRPVALLVVALAIAVSMLTSLGERGIASVGVIPGGLPQLAWPALRARDVDGVLPLAAACFLLAYVEGISAARTLAAKHGYEVHARQELLALGAANLATALFQGSPVAGGLSQSAVNDKAGARTPLALVFASLTIGACLLFLTNLLRDLPTVVLAAVVLMAVRGLFDVKALKHLWRVSTFEFCMALVAFFGVLVLGILKGVLLAVVVSLLVLLMSVAHPHVAILGRIPGSRRYSDLQRHPDNEAIEGVLIFRVEASLLYFNVDHVRSTIWATISAAHLPRLVIVDLSNAPYVDVAGAGMLSALHQELAARGIQLRVVEARSRARDLLRAEGLEEHVGYFGRHLSVDDAILEFEQSAPRGSAAKEQPR
jgi:high affinity sulfate transporter 1